VNAAALPSELLESELFGHERGAFTGAQNARIGKFEFANHGTLMLDEIGEMPPGLQAKLLHVLQDREFTKLGSNKPVSIDVRIIAATNRDLDAMMRAGSFREDLYYRLQVIEIFIPPLRERREEINHFIEFFLMKYSERYGRPLRKPSDTLRDALLNYAWPGNVRELENVVKRFVILQDEGLVLAELKRARTAAAEHATASVAAHTHASPPIGPPAPTHAPPVVAAPSPPAPPAPAATEPINESDEADETPAEPVVGSASVSLPELAREAAMKAERAAIQQALDRFRWNRRKAADALGVSYKTLLNKMKECGISEQV
jgi:transcriptional regulator with PAS, ATPase and Fis domain